MERQKPESQSDEVDIAKLFSNVGDSIKRGWFGFMRFLALLRRVPIENKWLFIVLVAISIGVGISFASLVRKNFYESKMILSSQFLNKKLGEAIIENLNGLATESSKKGLAAALSLPDSLARNIIGFSAVSFQNEKDVIDVEVLKEKIRSTPETETSEELIDDISKRIEVENQHSLEITVRTFNPQVIPNLQDAIFRYFESNPYIQKRITVNRENLANKKKKLAHDINKLDSLKSVIYLNYKTIAEQTRGSNNVILSDKGASDPVELYETDLEIYEEYQQTVMDLYVQKDLEIVDGFTAFSEPASASTTMIVIYSIFIGLLVAYLVVGLFSFNRYLANLQ